jgi:adenosylhomocysteine nucleosidase
VTSILVLTAVDIEARALARDLGLAARSAAWPHFRGGVLEVACVGLRARELSVRAAAFRAPTVVVSAGACGALAPGLREGALVVPEIVLTADGERLVTDALPGLARAGTLATVADVAGTPEAKARLWLETAALAVDLESAVIMRWARDRGARAAVVRGVSDTAMQAVPPELAALVTADGRVSAGRAARAILARPAALGPALALRRGTAAALRTVATALGTLARAEHA